MSIRYAPTIEAPRFSVTKWVRKRVRKAVRESPILFHRL
jgi:hypothetical protein